MSFSGHRGAVTCAAFSPDGVRIVTASNDKTARIGTPIQAPSSWSSRGTEGNRTSAAFRPDGAQVVTASNDGVAIIWDAETGEPLATLKGHGAGVTSAAFSPDGARIVTASKDETARTWNAKTGALLATLEGARRLCHLRGVQPGRRQHRNRFPRQDRPHMERHDRRAAPRSVPA